MKLQDVIKTGLLFKRPYHNSWMWIAENGRTIYNTPGGTKEEYKYTADDLLADDWMVANNLPIDNDWCGEDFRDRYPMGVLCWVWDDRRELRIPQVITYCDEGDSEYTFKSNRGAWWKHAVPITPDDPCIYKS